MEIKTIRVVKAFLLKKDRETKNKKREEKIKAIVKELLLDKSPKEAIKMLQDVTTVFNERLDIELKTSSESVEEILKYKKLV